jgi:hypothetical protein
MNDDSGRHDRTRRCHSLISIAQVGWWWLSRWGLSFFCEGVDCGWVRKGFENKIEPYGRFRVFIYRRA